MTSSGRSPPLASLRSDHMRFTFLGTGTSAGVPMIGCSCRVCTSDDPRDRRLRTSACLRFTDEKGSPRTILLDAGPDLRLQAIREGLDRCDAIVFTHNHVDHVFGLDEVRRFNDVQGSAVEIHADDHTMESLERIYAHIFRKERNVNPSFVATLLPFRVSPEVIDRGLPVRLHGVDFTPIPLLHGRLPVLGWRIDPDERLLTPAARALKIVQQHALPAAAAPGDERNRPRRGCLHAGECGGVVGRAWVVVGDAQPEAGARHSQPRR